MINDSIIISFQFALLNTIFYELNTPSSHLQDTLVRAEPLILSIFITYGWFVYLNE